MSNLDKAVCQCGHKWIDHCVGNECELCYTCKRFNEQISDRERQAQDFWERVYPTVYSEYFREAIGRGHPISENGKGKTLAEIVANETDRALAEWRKRWGGEK